MILASRITLFIRVIHFRIYRYIRAITKRIFLTENINDYVSRDRIHSQIFHY